MTPKQERFVEEYLIDLNATQAAIRAGYSQDTAYSQGQRLLTNVEVGNAIDERKEARSRETAIDAAWVLREAKGVYQTARASDRLSEALRALELIRKHVEVQADREAARKSIMSTEEARMIVATRIREYKRWIEDHADEQRVLPSP